MSKLSLLCLLLGVVTTSAFAQTIVNDAFINAGETRTLSPGEEYILDGLVFVEDGATLIIEPGTVVKARQTPDSGDNTSALIIARGGKIMAEGTAERPIIFTSTADDLTIADDLTWTDRGLWGGVIILGNATTNRGVEGQIEGIDTGEARAAYGGSDDRDNSGALRYVSIRHGGAALAPGDEINGLTMGAVGDQTVIEYVEVFSNLDDGFEWFGGTVNTKYLIAAFCADDGFDYDEGWRGKNQFWFGVQAEDEAGRVGEHDGGTVDETGEPFSTPEIRNATYIGPGSGITPEGDGDFAVVLRDNAGGFYVNSIFGEYPGSGVNIEDLGSGEDSRSRLENGDLAFTNNIWWSFGAGNDAAGVIPQDFVQPFLANANNRIIDPQYRSLSRQNDGGLDPRPAMNGPAASGARSTTDPFFENVGHYGAFDPKAPLWTNGWTALDAEGHTGEPTELVNDDSIQAGQTVKWRADTVYILDGLVFVESGATLVIEPGTVIKARQSPDSGDNTSALIVARDAQIFANGSQHKPIIFTSEFDDVSDPSDLTWTDRGFWGGLILLGNAATNRGVEGQIEGIDTSEARAAYGGDDDYDSSGILRYVSIRHGGAALAPGDEINGLTMGAVGSRTIIEHVEVFSNLDDGFEWFGGTVNTKHLVAAFCADDGFDYDEGWRGQNQFWFGVQAEDEAGRVGEHDGGTVDETGEPFSTPFIFNATYIGAGLQATPEGDGDFAIVFRDNAGGYYANAIITEYVGAGVNVEDLGSGEDSRSRLENGQLYLANSLWWNFGAGSGLSDIAPQDFVEAHLAVNNNQIADPQLRGLSRQNDGGLDPRPVAGGKASYGAIAGPTAFFDKVSYHGAFDPNAELWTDYWTALYQEGHTSRSRGSRWIGHVTRATGGFQTTVNMRNTGAYAASVSLEPYGLDGSALTPVSVSVPAGQVVSSLSSDLFNGEDVSHFAIKGSDAITVTASYRIAAGAGASAEASEIDALGKRFAFYQGEWDVVFDGVAWVNAGTASATVTLVQRAADGSVLGQATAAQDLAPGAKLLYLFDADLQSNPGSIIEIQSDQPAAPVFLRGTRPGVSPGYLYVTVPVGQ